MIAQTAKMNVPDRIGLTVRLLLLARLFDVGDILIHRPRNDVEIQPPSTLWLIVHELAQGFGGGITKPFVNGQSVAL